MLKFFVVLCFIIAAFANQKLVKLKAPSYKVSNLRNTNNGLVADLTLTSGRGPYGDDIKNLLLQVFFETQNRIRLKITDKDEKRWEVPANMIKSKTPDHSPKDLDYKVEIKDPFAIVITRLSNQEIIFDTRNLPFVYSKYYLEIGTNLIDENPHIYGLGERVHNFRNDPNDKKYVMFNKDAFTVEMKNLYGTHPFYVQKRGKAETTSAHGVFFSNSNAMEVHINKKKLHYRTIGGILNIYIFTGSLPQQVVKQYHEVIGKPVMIPYWSLGFHHTRWGYKTIDDTRKVVDGYRQHKIPLEVMWNDIDYMDKFKLFTLDPVNYPEHKVKALISNLHQNNQKYMMIVDPGVKTEKGYKMYDDGLEQKLYITKPDGVTPIVNRVWPGLTVFPDFTLYEKTGKYWEKYIREFHQRVPFDGLWLDMNEIVGFCNGECKTKNRTKSSKSSKFDPNNPPYMPGGESIYEKTLYMDSKTSLSIEYNTHDLYAHYENVATRKALDKLYNKRSLIITRSSYSGTGHYSGKWLGDNHSNWKNLFQSISGMLDMNIFGIPMVGADICGFFGNTNAELCIRWYQLGSFYPFARNHNMNESIPQEPWMFGQELIDASRKALLNRYSLLPYFYTQFYHSHVDGGEVIRSLPFEFPYDQSANINYLDRQFMVGPALLVSPVLEKDARSVYAYFPTEGFANVWYDFETGIEVMNTGRFQHIPAPLNHIPVHIRGGYIVPKQEPSMTTTESRKNPFHLIVAAAGSLLADGDLYLDDGESLDSISAKKFTLIRYSLTPGNFKNSFANKGYDVSKLQLKTISVYGAQNVCEMKFNGKPFRNFKYDVKTRILNIFDFNLRMNDEFEFVWSCL